MTEKKGENFFYIQKVQERKQKELKRDRKKERDEKKEREEKREKDRKRKREREKDRDLGRLRQKIENGIKIQKDKDREERVKNRFKEIKVEKG